MGTLGGVVTRGTGKDNITALARSIDEGFPQSCNQRALLNGCPKSLRPFLASFFLIRLQVKDDEKGKSTFSIAILPFTYNLSPRPQTASRALRNL
ncbi:hypothetical protein RvY_12395 [Ramazzottius varieornatus]|uniref:Uncharacterized protein n=1 Tax=Ramazzottius varieornatus TaxID=947166 RepID=A0A1D1VJD2_RAMVA|nr:hypothetical protein RvY_12395 [Ramazzottius varieornatus]